MGERIAVGILEEQLATYPDAVSMRLRSFDDDALLIHGNGKGGTRLDIGDADGTGFARNRADAFHRAEQWRARHVAPFQPATRTEHA